MQNKPLFRNYAKNFHSETKLEKTFNAILIFLLGFVLIFTPLSFGTVNEPSFYIAHISILGLVLVSILKMAFIRKFKLIKSFTLVPLFLFVGYTAVRYFFSDNPYYSRMEFLKIIDYSLIYLVIVNNFQRKKYFYSLIFLTILIGLFLSSLGIIQYFKEANKVYGIGLANEIVAVPSDGHQIHDAQSYFGIVTKPKPEQYGFRASGTFVCPNHLAGYLEMIIPLALAMSMLTRFVFGFRMLIGYSSLLIIAGWVLTFSRGGWIAGIVMLITFIILSYLRGEARSENRWILPMVIIIIALISIGIFVKPIQKRLLEISPTGDASSASRLKIWSDTIPMIKNKLFFGYGPGGYEWHFPRYKSHSINRKVTYTHNDYLNALADYGVFGTLIILFFIVLLFMKSRKIPEFFEHPDTQALMVGCLSAVVVVLFHAFFDFNNHIYSNALLFVVICGIYISVVSNVENEEEAYWKFDKLNNNIFMLIFVGIILVGIIISGIIQAGKLFLSEAYFQQGYALQYQILWNEASKKYEIAQKYDPKNPNIYGKLAEVLSAQNLFRIGIDNNQAINYYDTALKYNPYESDFLFKKALLLKRERKFKEASDVIGKAISQEPTNESYRVEYKKLDIILQRNKSAF